MGESAGTSLKLRIDRRVRLLFRAEAVCARVSETLVTAKHADQAYQEGWTSGAVCQEIGVSSGRGGSVP